MRRHRVVRDRKRTGHLPRRQARRLVTDKQAEHIETGGLRESRQGEDDRRIFHKSRLIEMSDIAQVREPDRGVDGGEKAAERLPAPQTVPLASPLPKY